MFEGADGGQCRNCGGFDFVVDYGCGECTCEHCGCVDGQLMVASASYKQVFDLNGDRMHAAPLVEYIPQGAASTNAVDALVVERQRNHNSAPYKRRTYLSERLSQWQMREPAIEPPDLNSIEAMYEEFNGGRHQHWSKHPEGSPYRIAPRWALDRPFTKEDCRTLLWEIDRRRARLGEKPYFVKKFLEKYLTIRALLKSESSLGARADPDFIDNVKTFFDRLQRPFDELVRIGEARYSFLNYNFVFRRIFDLLGCSHFGSDFPPLKSKKKRDDICRLWIKIIAELRLPYINKDGDLFGAEYATNIRTLTANGGAAGTSRKRKIAPAPVDTSGDDRRLRGKCDDGTHTQAASLLSFAQLSDLYESCRGVEFLHDRGTGDGHSLGLCLASL